MGMGSSIERSQQLVDAQTLKKIKININYVSKYQGYRDILNIPNPEAEVDAIMKAIDYNDSGAIDYTGKLQYHNTKEVN